LLFDFFIGWNVFFFDLKILFGSFNYLFANFLSDIVFIDCLFLDFFLHSFL